MLSVMPVRAWTKWPRGFSVQAREWYFFDQAAVFKLQKTHVDNVVIFGIEAGRLQVDDRPAAQLRGQCFSPI